MRLHTFFLLLVISVFSVAMGSVSLILAGQFFGPLPLTISQTTTNKDSSFNVTGESEVSVVPDNAQVTLGIEVTKPAVAEAQLQVNQVMNDLTNKLKAMGIEAKDIKTQNYSVYPNYDFSSGRQTTNGYRVSSSVLVNVREFEKINQVIDGAVGSGVTQVGGVAFKLSDEKEEEVKKQAREQAIVKAKKNAEELSGLAGMKLGRIINISEGQGSAQPPLMYDTLKTMSAESAVINQATDIEAGTSIYRYTVTLSYETQ